MNRFSGFLFPLSSWQAPLVTAKRGCQPNGEQILDGEAIGRRGWSKHVFSGPQSALRIGLNPKTLEPRAALWGALTRH